MDDSTKDRGLPGNELDSKRQKVAAILDYLSRIATEFGDRETVTAEIEYLESCGRLLENRWALPESSTMTELLLMHDVFLQSEKNVQDHIRRIMQLQCLEFLDQARLLIDRSEAGAAILREVRKRATACRKLLEGTASDLTPDGNLEV